jgi:hypothetical protein
MFKEAADYYMASLRMSGRANLRALGQRCRAKYARGVNLVDVHDAATFTPTFFVDPGRIFLTYDRLVHEALVPAPDEQEPFWQEVKRAAETYDPERELLWVVISMLGDNHTEAYLYRIAIPF